MKTLFNRYSGGNPGLLIAPTIWAFLENLCSIAPAILAMVAIGQLVANFLPGGEMNLDLLWQCCIWMIALMCLQAIVSILAYRNSYYGAQRATGRMRQAIVAKMRQLPLGFYANKESGELSNTFVTDPDKLDQAICFFIPQIISMGVLSLLSFVMLMTIDWQLAIPMYVALPVCLLLMGLAMKLRHGQAATIRQVRARATTLLNEYLLGMRHLKSYNQTGTGFARLDDAYRRLAKENTREEGVPGAITLLAAHGIHFGIPFIILTAAGRLVAGNVDLTILLAFLILATRLYAPLATAITCVINLKASSVAADRVNSLLNEPRQTGAEGLLEPGDIVFDQVSFSYDREEVIKEVSLVAPQKGLTALVGPSGSGKSTLLRLACRFWEVTDGEIRIGEQPIRSTEPEALNKQIAMVFQENYLFGDTIRNNLIFGQTNKTEDEMILACQKARCHDFIMKLQQGYDTKIGEGGATLSGGERQRIAIARAILKDAPILFLDEATASLDAENEILIQQAIDELIKDKTVMMIAHRLKTVVGADQIVVLNKGRIVQMGNHHDLLTERNGLYAHLWALQNQAQKWNI